MPRVGPKVRNQDLNCIERVRRRIDSWMTSPDISCEGCPKAVLWVSTPETFQRWHFNVKVQVFKPKSASLLCHLQYGCPRVTNKPVLHPSILCMCRVTRLGCMEELYSGKFCLWKWTSGISCVMAKYLYENILEIDCHKSIPRLQSFWLS